MRHNENASSAEQDDQMLAKCARQLCWRRRQTPQEILRGLAEAVGAEEEPDTYGSGRIVGDVEEMVAEALGKERALLFVTGVQAQLCALRIWCEHHGHPRVAYHPHAHFEAHEEGALLRLHNIDRHHLGHRARLVTTRDIENAPPNISAFVLELPQRDLGGELPSFEDLTDQCAAIAQRGVASHLDGARLFEASAYYERPLSAIAAPFSSVYVSNYKGLGAFAGAFLAGDEGFIKEAKAWRRRHGGECFQLFPFAVAAREAWQGNAKKFGRWREHAVAIAAALSTVEGIRLRPSVPQANMMHVFLDMSAAAARVATVEIGRRHDVCLMRRPRPTDVPGTTAFEFPVHDGAMDFEPDEVARLFEEFVEVGLAFDQQVTPVELP